MKAAGPGVDSYRPLATMLEDDYILVAVLLGDGEFSSVNEFMEEEVRW